MIPPTVRTRTGLVLSLYPFFFVSGSHIVVFLLGNYRYMLNKWKQLSPEKNSIVQSFYQIFNLKFKLE